MLFPPDSPFTRLLAGPMGPGALAWIGLRPARKAAMVNTVSARLIAGRGLGRDHYDGACNGPRQVTPVATEDRGAIAGFLGKETAAPEQLCRNLATRGIYLLALKDRRFRIGEVALQDSGECAPCGLMEITLGSGGYKAASGRCGITARVVEDGEARVGDTVVRLDPDGATAPDLG
jgi:MOSC domain-containing protein YiiM